MREKGVILRDTENKDENHNFIPYDLTNYKVVYQRQFAMNKMKAWQGSYGVSYHNGIVSPAYFVFDVKGVSEDYFHLAIRSKAYVPYFAQASDGVRIDQWDLSKARMRQIPLLIPSAIEQAAIVRYLDHVDQRIQRYVSVKQKLTDLLEEQRQAVIYRAVTRGLDPKVRLKPSGVSWIGDVPMHWEITALRHRYSQCLGKMLDSKRITGSYLLPYLRNIDIQWDQINTQDLPRMDILPSEYNRYTVQYGDLLVCEGGEIGRCAIWADELDLCGYQKALHRLRPHATNRDIPRFLYYVFRTAVKNQSFTDGHVSTIAHLTGDKLRTQRFPFPPFPEQVAIVEYLDKATADIDTAIGRTHREIELVREYRERLIADVVTGKLDVREAAEQLPEPGEKADEPPPSGETEVHTEDGRCVSDHVVPSSEVAGA